MPRDIRTARARDPVPAPARTLLLAGLTALLVACGGGGSSGSVGSAGGPAAFGGSGTSGGSGGSAATGSGSIDVTVGDAPSDDYDEILITISEVRLLGGDDDGDGDEADGDDGPGIVIGDETVTIDLLALDAMTELLVSEDGVPAGEYTKVRLQVDSIVANVLDEAGNVVESDEVRVVANGKVDLNPRGPFTLADDGDLVIQLDIDADRSFQLTGAGASGMIRFRPVVFVDVLDADDESGRITFLAGTATLLAGQDGDDAFDLCAIQPLTGDSDRDPEDCERIEFEDETSIFDADGSVIEFGAIEDASPVVVAGRFGRDDDDEDEDEDEFDALLIDVGPAATFVSRSGLVVEAPVDGVFPFDPADDEGTTALDVTVADGALIFDATGEILDASALVAGADVRVMGLAQTDEADALTGYLASALSVKTDAAGDVEVDGDIVSIDGDTLQITEDAAEPDVCVVFDDDTDISLFAEDADSAESTPGTAADLVVGAEVDVIGTDEGGPCVVADSIVIELDDDEDDDDGEDEADDSDEDDSAGG